MLYGEAGTDTIYGHIGDDFISGGAGADTLDGGSGFDMADYSDSGAAITLRLWQGIGVGGHAQGDSVANFEAITGSDFDDVLVGNNDDTANTLIGGAGNDNLKGLGGDDLLIGGMGMDVIDGGTGVDTADYSDSGAGFTLRLWQGIGVGGQAHGDTVIGIENIIGSAF